MSQSLTHLQEIDCTLGTIDSFYQERASVQASQITRRTVSCSTQRLAPTPPKKIHPRYTRMNRAARRKPIVVATSEPVICAEAPLRTAVAVAGGLGTPDVLLDTAVPFPVGPGIPPVPVLELSGTEPVGPPDPDNLEVDTGTPPVPVKVAVPVGPTSVIFRNVNDAPTLGTYHCPSLGVC